MIIDSHTHIFPDNVCARIVDGMSRDGGIVHYTNASAAELSASMKAAGIDYSIDLPVATRVDQVEKINSRMISLKDELLSQGIIPFGCIHPDYENYKAEIARLRDAGIAGIKLRPPYQGVDLNDIRYKRLIGAISDSGMITLFHAGWDVYDSHHNYATVDMILELIKDVAPERLVAAHMGGWISWTEVAGRLLGAPLWIDTSCSLGDMKLRQDIPHDQAIMFSQGLTQEQFNYMVHAHGADRVLFGSDCPWQDQSDYVRKIKNSGLSQEEIEKILSGNAVSLLKSAHFNVSSLFD